MLPAAWVTLAEGGWARRTWRKDHCLAACLLGARPVLTHGALCSLNPGQSYWHPTPSLPRWPPGCPLGLIYLLAHPLGPFSQLTSRDHHTPIHPGQAACSQVFMKDRRAEYDNKERGKRGGREGKEKQAWKERDRRMKASAKGWLGLQEEGWERVMLRKRELGCVRRWFFEFLWRWRRSPSYFSPATCFLIAVL